MPSLSNSWLKMLSGLMIGVGVGFLFERGRVIRHEVVTGLIKFEDFTIIKIAITDIFTGFVGIQILRAIKIVIDKKSVSVIWTIISWL